jgi:hypothetical protein
MTMGEFRHGSVPGLIRIIIMADFEVVLINSSMMEKGFEYEAKLCELYYGRKSRACHY